MTTTIVQQMTVPEGLGEVDWFDGFCGAGGSANGLEFVPGFKVTCAVNHWPEAVEAHNGNFQHADHHLHDIDLLHPSKVRRTRCAWFSPECTFHARARGKRQTTEEAVRSRMTMMDVPRYTEYHRYDVVIVENVIEAALWEDWASWIRAMTNLGYEYRIVMFNSQFALVPQSRDRMYVVFWRKGLKAPNLDFTPPAYCSTCECVVPGLQTWKPASKGSSRDTTMFEWGRYGANYLYLCPQCETSVAPAVIGAKHIVNWDDLGIRIGDRPAHGLAPLKPKTRIRIKVGMERLNTTRPIAVQVGGHLYERQGYARVWSLDDPMRTITTTNYMAMVVPQKNASIAGAVEEPTSTLTARSSQALLVRAGGQAPSPRLIDEPTMTTTAHDRQIGLLVYNGVPGFVRELEDAAGTITARDKQSLLVPYYRTGVAHSVEEPHGAMTPKQRDGLLVVTDDDIDACTFRMLKWPELLKGQAMHVKADGSAYILEARTRNPKTGKWRTLSDESKTKMIGNAVSSTVAAMLGFAIAPTLVSAA